MLLVNHSLEPEKIKHIRETEETMTINIRQCLIDELETLHLIGYETFDETFRPMNSPETMDQYLQESFSMKKLSEELSSTSCKFYFIYYKKELVGYLKINFAPAQSDINDPKSIEVERIYVRTEHKGKGLGKELMDYALQQAKIRNMDYVWLGVWEKNVTAIAFYQKMGFREAGHHLFQMGKEQQFDVIMKKSLKK